MYIYGGEILQQLHIADQPSEDWKVPLSRQKSQLNQSLGFYGFLDFTAAFNFIFFFINFNFILGFYL